jgi:hypothetical protein
MAKKQKCARCGKELLHFMMVLWNGANGYRRYPMDEKCKAIVEEANKKNLKSKVVQNGCATIQF